MVFGPADISGFVLAAIGLTLTVLNIIDKAATIRNRAEEPDRLRDEKIGHLEERIDELESRLDQDDHRIETLEAGQRELLHGVSALLSYYLDNTSKEEIQKAKTDLDNYLIDK